MDSLELANILTHSGASLYILPGPYFHFYYMPNNGELPSFGVPSREVMGQH